jgi:hypothetical protein
VVARNGWKGGHRQLMRELIKAVNTQVKESREMIDRCPNK